jgi:hypothetical protein
MSESAKTASRLILETDEIVRFEVISCDIILRPESPEAAAIKYGFEGGRVIKMGNTYHMITAEMAGDPQNVNMCLAYWTSENGTRWMRRSTLRKSDGDFTGASQRAAVWGPMPVFNEPDNRWHLVYVCYKGKPGQSNYDGVIQHAVSDVGGKDGIGGPYTDKGEILRYDDHPDPWEGLQGTDSFFPYRIGNKWYGFYGSATLEKETGCKWNIGLAQADLIEGPWTRMSERNPVEPNAFAENPIVLQLENGVYIAIVDGGPWVNKMGYLLSWDGLNWSNIRYFELEPTVRKWYTATRTPLSLIKEDDGTYTMFFTAFMKNGENTFGAFSRLKLHLTFVD